MFITNLYSECKQFDYLEYGLKMRNEYITEMQNLYPVICDGGGHKIGTFFNGFMIHFTTREKLNIRKARSLYIKLSEGLINKINSDKLIRPYLAEYPFNINDLDISLGYDNPNHEKDAIVSILIYEGEIMYYLDDPEGIRLKKIFTESYQDAKNIVLGGSYSNEN